MLHKCANPACLNVFRRLNEGKLFQVQTEYLDPTSNLPARNPKAGRRIEHFWLCEACSAFLTLAFDKARGMMTVPLPEAQGKKPLSSVRLKLEEHRQQAVLSVGD